MAVDPESSRGAMGMYSCPCPRTPSIAAVLLLLLTLPACDRTSKSAPAPAPADDARPLRVVISGDTAGWITPCGCTANQSGGLLRRGSYLDAARHDATVLYADAGGAVTGNSAYQRLKLTAI